MINFRRTLYCITYFFSHHLCYLGLQSSVTFKVITGGAVPIIFLSRNATCLRSVHCPGLSHSHISAKMGTHTSQSCSPHLEYLHDCDTCQLPPAIRPAPSNTQTDTHTHSSMLDAILEFKGKCIILKKWYGEKLYINTMTECACPCD